MYFCRSWFSNMVSFIYVLVFLSFLHDIFSNKFYRISFLCKHNFFIDEKHAQWMLDTKVKVFHDSASCFMKWPWNCISWNALKEKFHSVYFPEDFLINSYSVNTVKLCRSAGLCHQKPLQFSADKWYKQCLKCYPISLSKRK